MEGCTNLSMIRGQSELLISKTKIKYNGDDTTVINL